MQVAIGLTFPGKLKDEAVICHICKDFDIDVNILEASFSMSSGWAILEFDGEKGEIEKVFSYLTDKGIKIARIKTKK